MDIDDEPSVGAAFAAAMRHSTIAHVDEDGEYVVRHQPYVDSAVLARHLRVRLRGSARVLQRYPRHDTHTYMRA
jgi:hypothetical protein